MKHGSKGKKKVTGGEKKNEEAEKLQWREREKREAEPEVEKPGVNDAAAEKLLHVVDAICSHNFHLL